MNPSVFMNTYKLSMSNSQHGDSTSSKVFSIPTVNDYLRWKYHQFLTVKGFLKAIPYDVHSQIFPWKKIKSRFFQTTQHLIPRKNYNLHVA
jgi:hypothetical protein